jgi:hypothetical protein
MVKMQDLDYSGVGGGKHPHQRNNNINMVWLGEIRTRI